MTQDVKGSKEVYFCGYRKIGARNFGEVGGGNQAREEYILRYYPIAVQTELIIDGKEITIEHDKLRGGHAGYGGMMGENRRKGN